MHGPPHRPSAPLCWHVTCSRSARPSCDTHLESLWFRITRLPSASRNSGLPCAAQRARTLPSYGFVVHSRRQSERPSLGLITLHGESLAFNERLLKSLDGLPLWLFGHARITLVPGVSISPTEGGRTKQADRPLASMLMHIATFDTSTGVTQHLVQVEAVVKAESLVQPLLILAPTRPAAWPL